MRYRMDDSRVVDSDKAAASYDEATRFDGRNRISIPTGSQWEHEKLCRSRKGNYYIVSWSQWQGSTPHAYWVTDEEAAAWLVLNEHEVPEALQPADVTE